MNGIITDIQKFSLHDGNGIRTTIFFKGCNMHCEWCHNPETLSEKPEEAFYAEKCIHCGHCDRCPTGARVTLGRTVCADEVLREVSSDLPYYHASGGGVTLSGGEPLLQADFAKELLQLLKETGISTAMETNLSLPFERIAKLLPYLDCIFYDIKVMDDALHRRVTGISNKSILENSKLLAKTGIPAVVRTPLIPDITATAENLAAIATFCASLPNVRAYEILNFNPLGEEKYRALNKKWTFKGTQPFKKDVLHTLAASAHGYGIKVLYGQE